MITDENKLRAAVQQILLDMLQASSRCHCCDNRQEHQELLRKSLARVEPQLWPFSADIPAWMRASSDPVIGETVGMITRRGQ